MGDDSSHRPSFSVISAFEFLLNGLKTGMKACSEQINNPDPK